MALTQQCINGHKPIYIDAGRIIRGREAIRDWAASDIFAAKVTLDPLDATDDEHGVTITAKVDGTFDRTGLPDPLIMTFKLVARGGKITKLTRGLAESSGVYVLLRFRGYIKRCDRSWSAKLPPFRENDRLLAWLTYNDQSV